MNPILLLFADGHSFFLGMGIVGAAVVSRQWLIHRFARVPLTVAEIIGVVFVIGSSTPFPVWVYYIWIALWAGLLVVPIARKRWIAISVFLVFSVTLCGLEVPHHFLHYVNVRADESVYVIGDSLSAGLGGPERVWPAVLGDISHLNVTNLAVAGATAASALPQADLITQPDSLVFVEIGGNDLFGDATGEQFLKDLDALLSKIPASCSVVMFELPLYPFDNRFDVVQRAMAAKHHVMLLPKEILTEAVGGRDNRIDGIHLSQKGHDTLAALVYGDLLINR